ncbi:MAG: YqgE/AlgH family protein [Bacteroidales bacterium]|jgi:Putative transcriptional regulator|nr:YqgE/AlgH family protein [Bacteroidales bacterium]HOA09418.1 YqgE/AlgH family protein [Tenuifilaceae bacterium]MBP8643126.1 YqgE/AlgH family protein [Bacteroidales bacterium]HOC36328.1 YqgE/AlgH family protein [Tenuifilaceae bacterium]HOG72041.1 YqgE/AlgH family protein [Tenuifilaceae bacterium]
MAKFKPSEMDFFKFDFRQIPPKAGRLLIAQPSLTDPFFKRTVIYLVEHDDEGSMGFILNRKLAMSLNDLLNNFPNVEANVSVGGPVGSDTVNFIHTFGSTIPNTLDLGNGLYLNGDIDAVKALAIAGRLTRENFRIFIGYSGWGKDQLKREIDEDSWVVANFDSQLMAKGAYDSWYFAVQQLGSRFKAWTLYPENPALN